MRALPIVMLSLSLTGCSLLHKSTTPTTSQPETPSAVETTPKSKPTPPATPAVLYKSAEELVGKPFHDMGEVSGSSCQATAQDPQPSIATARKRLQSRATNLKANAVLLHECQIVSDVDSCYRQAICEGTALKVSSQ
ncbi:Rcs stress response system protein RcsF [Lonsdalea quercina]|uniref:Outer membrane lipoprotein RcsF n=1 Tax=Lonsdalea quercina TaxID=71657 RepID=A0A1H4AEN3_9GAMM|nr:Rcs stress response system protein RcsF [Lonsdalea quercina]SEA34346.1 RcsF protein [Lonsdalea quercina]